MGKITSMAFPGITFCLDWCLNAAFSHYKLLHWVGFLQELCHHWHLLTLIKPMSRMSLLWLWLKIVNWNLIGSIVLYGCCTNLPGAFLLQLSRLNWLEMIQSLPWHGLGLMYMRGINKLHTRYKRAAQIHTRPQWSSRVSMICDILPVLITNPIVSIKFYNNNFVCWFAYFSLSSASNNLSYLLSWTSFI